MNGEGVYSGAEAVTRVLPHFSGRRRTSQQKMSKRVIDLTDDAESSQRANEQSSEEEDGMQVDVSPSAATTIALNLNRSARSLPGVMAPDHPTSYFSNPTTHFANPNLPPHTFNNVFTDEVVLTSFVIFKFFADFPPEITELLCHWITKIAHAKEQLFATDAFGKDNDNPFFVIDPTFPEDIAVISTGLSSYNMFRLRTRDNTFSLISLVCPFEKFIARVFLNILQIQRAEMTLRENERKWRLHLAKTFAQAFPGQKILLTVDMPSVQGAHTKVTVPSVCFHLSDMFGNIIRPFSFVALKLPASVNHLFATAVAHPDFKCFNGLPPLSELTQEFANQPIYYPLNRILRGEPDGKAKYADLVPPSGLVQSTFTPRNNRLVFHIRNENFTEEDDELIFKFVVKQDD